MRDLDGTPPLGEFGAGAVQDLAARSDRAVEGINEGVKSPIRLAIAVSVEMRSPSGLRGYGYAGRRGRN